MAALDWSECPAVESVPGEVSGAWVLRGTRTPVKDSRLGLATQPKYVYSLRYNVGDVVIWDNASLLHSATLTDPDDPRTLWRITIKEPSAKLNALDVLAPTFARGAM